MIKFLLLFGFITISSARPNENVRLQNVLPGTPNGPGSQHWMNGQYSDVWTSVNPANVITVPPNCPAGQEFVNGQCRDVWRNILNEQDAEAVESNHLWPHNMITVPPNCRPGQQWINGSCRDVWRQDSVYPMNVITVPPNCPTGQEFVNGACRDVWRGAHGNKDGYWQNAITVPPNCKPGQQWIGGACRDVWIRSSDIMAKLLKNYEFFDAIGAKRQSEDKIETDSTIESFGSTSKNIINVPNQCPNGYKLDALGVCRPIFGILLFSTP